MNDAAAMQVSGLYLVTDSRITDTQALLAMVDAAVRGGARLVQLREKTLATRAFVERARVLKTLLAPREVPLIINDRLDVALASGADGLHIGQDDIAPEDARRLMPHGLIGLSLENLEQLGAAERAPVDYYGLSPLFATATKTDIGPPLGLVVLRTLRARTRRPVVAIGGINESNAAAAMGAGADALAVVSAVSAVPDPEAAARRLCVAMDRGLR